MIERRVAEAELCGRLVAAVEIAQDELARGACEAQIFFVGERSRRFDEGARGERRGNNRGSAARSKEGACLLVFAFVERRAVEPILPFDVLRNPIVSGSVVCMALVGMAMFGTISYVPLFVQGVIGTSATSSGVVLTPMTLGAVCTSILTGQLVSRTGRYRWNAVFGPVVLTIGMLLLWRMNTSTTNGEAARNMVIAGIGIGSMMQVFVLSVQNAVPRSRIGSATALTQFGRQMGATLGVTIIGVIVNHGLPAGVGAGAQGSAIHRLSPALRQGLASALRPAFLTAAAIAALVWIVAVVFVKEQTLRRTLDDVSAADAAAGAPATAGVESEP